MPGRAAGAQGEGDLWPDHRDALVAFLAIAGQWRCTGLANGALLWTGLDYAAAQAGLALAGLNPAPEVWNEVRQIEAGALEELNRVR
ncbi:MAG: DUF1799 domain-containing protein [Paracoccaceae bacterium]